MNGEELLAALGIDTRNGNGVVSADLHFRPTAPPTLTVEYAVGPLEEQRAISHVQTHRYELRDVTFRAPGDDAEVRSQMMRYIRAQYGDDGPPPPRRLGKLPYQHDRRTLHLATYITQPLPAAPVSWTALRNIRDWPMYGNDRLGNCVAEGTLVSAPDAMMGYRLPYHGPAVTLAFESGKRLTVTPNHAVLTPRGFVLAGSLNEGDYAIGTVGAQPLPSNIDFDHAPTRIEQVVETLGGSGSVARQVPQSVLAAVDFHGDARFVNGDINVVNAHGLLERELNAALSEPYRHQQVGTARQLQRDLHRGRTTFQRRAIGRAVTLGVVSGGSQRFALSHGHAGVAKPNGLPQSAALIPRIIDRTFESASRDPELASQRLNSLPGDVSLYGLSKVGGRETKAHGGGFADRAWPVASVAHPSPDGAATDPEIARDLIDRFPGFVQADRVIKIERHSFRGHVYDLSTSSRYYVANGIIAHNCTCAAAGHLIEAWTTEEGLVIDVPEQAVIAMYEAITGGQDTGAVELDVLRYWRKNGLAGHKPFAFALIDRMAHEHVKLAASLFAGVYIGIALPKSAQAQTGPHSLWDVDAHGGADAQPGSWGGHAVNVVGYDESTVTVVTWGFLQRMTWAFWDKYCVTPETRVLTDDLRWVPAGSLSVGDGLAGFDEDTTFSRGSLGHARRWRSSVVEEASRIMRPCYELTFDDGTRVRCSAEHKWLTANHRGSRWLTTEALHCGPNAASNVVKPVDVWDEDMSREAGYLAAAFDGEGSLIQSHVDRAAGSLRLTFTQKLNPMLARVMETLEDKGYPATTPNVREDGVVTLTIQQRKEALRFLGSIRPARLLPKLDLDNLGQMSVKTVKLISKRFIGDQEVVAMRTSTGTYFAEGLASHNCDEVWALLPAEWKHTPPKIQGFEFGQFTRDLGRVGRLES